MVCQHILVTTSHSEICTKCGKENQLLKLDTYNVYSAPISKSYDRRQRFFIKVDKLLLIHSGPKEKDAIWKALEGNSFKNPSDIRFHLRHKTKLLCKHYDCIRTFSKIFAQFDVQTKRSVHHIKADIQRSFQQILYGWNKYFFGTLFFSTDWLLRRFVKRYCPELVVFLKPIPKSNRSLKYVEMLQTISTNGCHSL